MELGPAAASSPDPADEHGAADRQDHAVHTASRRVLDRLRARSGVTIDDVPSLVVAISAIPYGRPSVPSGDGAVAAVVDEWRGTCSSKHLLLRATVPLVEPGWRVDLIHRVYRVDPAEARRRWSDQVAQHVPAGGLVDVHTYGILQPGGVVVDVTLPVEAWDGRTPLRLACTEGEDVPAGDDPGATKAALVDRHCDPAVREGFIAALAAEYGEGPPPTRAPIRA